MKIITRCLGAVCLLPATVLYAGGLFAALQLGLLNVTGYGDFGALSLIATVLFLILGFALYAGWRFLFIVTRAPTPDGKQRIPRHVWTGVVIGLLASVIGSGAILSEPLSFEGVGYVFISGAPGFAAIVLVARHFRKDEEASDLAAQGESI